MTKRNSDCNDDKDTEPKKIDLGYNGWKVPFDGYEIDSISIHDITPNEFYNQYISTRRPCVLKGFIQDEEWKAHEKWTNEYLREKLEEFELDIEKRESTKDSFGQGKELKMKFTEFLKLIQEGNGLYYLTTQNVKAKVDGRPNLMAPFMRILRGDFPIRPKLMGNLIPQNLNVWMGNNAEGSTSGLHHDYHDNLYLVLRGKKQFRLYSPQDAPNMYTRGKLAQIHPNGRINYENELTTPDGADLKSLAAQEANLEKEKAEQELAQAEDDVANNVPGAQERLERAEAQLDKALDAMLDAEIDSDEENNEVFEEDEDEFNYENELTNLDEVDLKSEAAVRANLDKEKAEQELLQAEKDLANNVPGAKERLERAEDQLDKALDATLDAEMDGDGDDKKLDAVDEEVIVEDDEDRIKFGEGVIEEDEDEVRIADKTVKDPLNFSLIDLLNLSETEVKEKYPDFHKAKRAFCEVKEGNMLYLPASWFHEVKSYGASGGHLAFNYWFHPPDGSDFSKPYFSSFWPNDWKSRLAEECQTF